MKSRLALFFLAIIASQISLACTLRDSQSETFFSLNLTDAECRTISYTSGNIIQILISYPQGNVVTYAWKEKKIHVRIYYTTDYDITRLFTYAKYLRREGEMEVYDISNQENFVFRGTDKAIVVVNKIGKTWLARRMYAQGLVINYQYDEDIETFKEVDALVHSFIVRVLEEKE